MGDVARRSFGTVRRGFDPQEVRTYLGLLARAIEHANLREQELLDALEEAEERARHPVIDESVLTSSLGQRSAAVLRGAHEEAARILSQAEEAAAAMVREAQQQATNAQVNAEAFAAERIAEAELEASSLRQQARDEAATVVDVAREEGEAVVERAREHGRSMLDQAQEARRRVIADMAHRRRLMMDQIELFRAARDEIAGSVVGVRRSLDRIVEDLSSAEDSARAAAARAARSGSVDVPESVLVEEGERAVAELGALGGPEATFDSATPYDRVDEPGDRSPRAVLRFDDVATVVEPPQYGVPEGTESSMAGGTGGADSEANEPAASGEPAAPGEPAVEAGPAAPAASGEPAAEAGPGAAAEPTTAAGPAEPAAAVVPEPPSPDAPEFARRAEVLDPVVTTLSRRLKRALQDDQNLLLDRLRKGTGEWRHELLLDEASQRALYAEVAVEPVRDAMTAGVAFARSIAGGRRTRTSAAEEHAVEAVTGELASTVVTLIRRRLEGAEIADASERVGAAYREWRGERIERLAEDSAVEAFSRGVLAGAGRHGVRWSRSEVGPGCADCEDNALAGALSPGDEFPTGHLHPPAHAGCRCLVVPTPS